MTRTMIGLRLPPALLKAFDKWWKREGSHNRTHAIEGLMKTAIATSYRVKIVTGPPMQVKTRVEEKSK